MRRAAFLGVLVLLVVAGCSMPRVMVLDDPLSSREHLELGMAYEEKGEHDLAIREYRDAVKEIPLAHLFLGNVYFLKENYASAERQFKKAIEKLPEDPRAYNNLAWLFFVQRKNLDEARALAQRAVELAPEDESAEYRDTLFRIEDLRQRGEGRK